MVIPPKVIDWLLDKDNPPVRYLTLTKLLQKPANNPQLIHARSHLMDYKVTQAILRHFPNFKDDEDDRAYWKYTGKYWQLIFLAHFLAEGKDPRITYLIRTILDRRSWITKSGGQCLTANILQALMKLGEDQHPVVIRETEALAKRIQTDGGAKCSAMDYSPLACCYMAQPKLLLCFAHIPPKKRSKSINAALKLLTKNLLKNEIYVYVPGKRKEWEQILARKPKPADLPKGQTVKNWIAQQRKDFQTSTQDAPRQPKKGWLKFGFPLHYNSDILEAMYALALLETPMSSKLKIPLQAIKGKMTPEGRWRMENSLNGKMLVDVEGKGEPSKWLTYFGWCVLNHFDPSGKH